MNQKYVYWLDKKDLDAVCRTLQDQDLRIEVESKVVCAPLAQKVDIGIVPPGTWSNTQICRRQLSWHPVSRHAGQYLLISSKDLAEFELQAQIILRPNPDFKPPALPQKNDLLQMLQSSSYLRHKPIAWDDLQSEDPAKLNRWLKSVGIRNIDFQELFIYHCANHANFMDPVYFTREQGQIVPYSIAQTKYVCSACLELFNIIGQDFALKRVVPCPGAVIFAGLAVNRYIEAITIS